VKGAVASLKPIMPTEVKQAAPNWFFLIANGLTLIPRKWKRKFEALIKTVTTKAGRYFVIPVLCL
jgi:hypothetical protein